MTTLYLGAVYRYQPAWLDRRLFFVAGGGVGRFSNEMSAEIQDTTGGFIRSSSQTLSDTGPTLRMGLGGVIARIRKGPAIELAANVYGLRVGEGGVVYLALVGGISF